MSNLRKMEDQLCYLYRSCEKGFSIQRKNLLPSIQFLMAKKIKHYKFLCRLDVDGTGSTTGDRPSRYTAAAVRWRTAKPERGESATARSALDKVTIENLLESPQSQENILCQDSILIRRSRERENFRNARNWERLQACGVCCFNSFCIRDKLGSCFGQTTAFLR